VKLSELNEKQRGMIDPEDRKRHKIRLLSEKLLKAQAGREKIEHNTVLAWCSLNRLKCVHAPCSRKVKDLEPGFPDFMFYRNGRYLFVEMKVLGGYLSEDQKNFHQELRDQGDEVFITWSADETIRLLRGWLWEHFRWTPVQE
jgi:VRR-NUC domain